MSTNPIVEYIRLDSYDLFERMGASIIQRLIRDVKKADIFPTQIIIMYLRLNRISSAPHNTYILAWKNAYPQYTRNGMSLVDAVREWMRVIKAPVYALHIEDSHNMIGFVADFMRGVRIRALVIDGVNIQHHLHELNAIYESSVPTRPTLRTLVINPIENARDWVEELQPLLANFTCNITELGIGISNVQPSQLSTIISMLRTWHITTLSLRGGNQLNDTVGTQIAVYGVASGILKRLELLSTNGITEVTVQMLTKALTSSKCRLRILNAQNINQPDETVASALAVMLTRVLHSRSGSFHPLRYVNILGKTVPYLVPGRITIYPQPPIVTDTYTPVNFNLFRPNGGPLTSSNCAILHLISDPDTITGLPQSLHGWAISTIYPAMVHRYCLLTAMPFPSPSMPKACTEIRWKEFYYLRFRVEEFIKDENEFKFIEFPFSRTTLNASIDAARHRQPASTLRNSFFQRWRHIPEVSNALGNGIPSLFSSEYFSAKK